MGTTSSWLTEVYALAHTRASRDKSYTALDLTDTTAVEEYFKNTKIDGGSEDGGMRG